FFFSSRRRHTRFSRDWSSDVCSSDLEGVKVYDREDAKKLIQKSEHKNLELIFAIHTITTVQKNEISEEFMDLGISLRVVPPVEKWINGQLSSSQIADISIEDLLERAPNQ